MLNSYKSAFEPIRRSHDDVPILDASGRKTFPADIGRNYSRELREGKIIRSYATSTHLIDSEGQPTSPSRGENDRSRNRMLVAALASVTLAASGALAYVVVKAASHNHGPDVAPLVHHIQENENNHDPMQNPTQVTPAEERQAAAIANSP